MSGMAKDFDPIRTRGLSVPLKRMGADLTAGCVQSYRSAGGQKFSATSATVA